jgi:hypothetical protein
VNPLGDKVQTLYNRARELAESEETEYGRLFASGQVDAFSQVLRAIGEAETLRTERRQKQPEGKVWECAATEETMGAHRGWTPKQPNGDASWELCAVAPLDNRPNTPFVRCFWKRLLP